MQCAKVIVHRGKFEPREGIPTRTGKISDVKTDTGYKYLGVLQTNVNMQNKIKAEAEQTYIKGIKQALMSILNCRYKILAVNRNAVPIISLTAEVISWIQN